MCSFEEEERMVEGECVVCNLNALLGSGGMELLLVVVEPPVHPRQVARDEPVFRARETRAGLLVPCGVGY